MNDKNFLSIGFLDISLPVYSFIAPFMSFIFLAIFESNTGGLKGFGLDFTNPTDSDSLSKTV